MYENKTSYNFYFFDLTLIFLFYVLGDTITTYLGLKMGYLEAGKIPAIILNNSEYGIIIIFIIKLFVLILLCIVIKYWIKKEQFKIITILNVTIICYGIYLTVANTLLIVSGHNILPILCLNW